MWKTKEKCSLCAYVQIIQVCTCIPQSMSCSQARSMVKTPQGKGRHVSIPTGFSNWESKMTLFLFFHNCVKEQCYQEKSSESWVEHNRRRWKRDTRSSVSRGRIFYLLAADSQLIMQAVINIEAGDNMGRACRSQATGEQQSSLLSFSFTHGFP
jgi:hypothetical protein